MSVLSVSEFGPAGSRELDFLRDSIGNLPYTVQRVQVDSQTFYKFYYQGLFVFKGNFDQAVNYIQSITGDRTVFQRNRVPITHGDQTLNPEIRQSIANKTQGSSSEEQWINIADWKSHAVKKGEIYEFEVDLKGWIIWASIRAGGGILSPLTGKQKTILDKIRGKQDREVVRILIEETAKQNTDIGQLSQYVIFDYGRSRFDSATATLTMSFYVQKNVWQLLLVGVAIAGVLYVGSLTIVPVVKEVRLLVRGYEAKTPAGEFLKEIQGILIVAAIGVFFILPMLKPK